MTTPQWHDGEASLRNDIQLVKAAVLYADEVELLGLAASMVYSIGLAPGSESLTFSQLMRLSESANGRPFIPNEVRSVLPKLDALRKNGEPIPAELQALFEELDRMTAESNELLRKGQEEILAMTGAEELRLALEQGVVRVPDLRVGMEQAVAAAAAHQRGERRRVSDEEIQRWLDEIAARLGDRRTRLLFDHEAGGLVQSMLREGVISPSQAGLRLAGKAAVGAGLVARLPAFSDAPMDELLDLRSDLDAPLTRYRAAVARFSQDLPGVVGSDLDHEVEHLWERSVAPALVEIDELLVQHGLVKELARQVAQDVAKYLTYAGGVYVGLGAATDVGQVAASVAGAVPGLAEASARTLLARSSGARKAAGHELFYLREINRRMSGP